MNKYLFIFTIGPVQSFIAQARKVQDLFAGSVMLSDLLSLCINETRGLGHDIIFPYSFDKEPVIKKHIEGYAGHGTPNRMVALLKLSSPADVQKFGDDLKLLCLQCFVETAINVFKKSGVEPLPDGINEQLTEMLDAYWAAIPFHEDEYQHHYRKLEEAIGAVKSVRRFGQLEEKGRKCNVNGQYNVKFYRKTEQEQSRLDKSLKESKLFAADNMIIGYHEDRPLRLKHIQPGEGLSGISLLKRLYKQYNGSYPSTAEVALKHLICNTELQNLVEEYERSFKDGDFDYQLLYEENQTPGYIKKYGIEPKINLKESLKVFKKIESKIREVNNRGARLRLTKHYAIIRFDGDNMGQWLDSARSVEEHQSISKALANLARKSAEVVNNPDYFGKTIYAGGDDFLGVLNLSMLFPVLTELNQAIEETSKKFPVTRSGSVFSCSFSVFITHYKVPLSKALTMSNQLLKDVKESKNLSDKNGLGIGFFKKSGLIGQVIVPNTQLKTLEEIWNGIENDQFNPRFIYKFAEEFARWSDVVKFEDSHEFDSHEALLKAEFIRLIQRGLDKQKQLHAREAGEKIYRSLQCADSRNNTIDLTPLINGVRIMEALHATI